MNSLSKYINTNVQYINYINESLENNTRIINENQLLLEHGKELDRIWYKVRCAIKQEYNPYINESNYINTKFNAHESNIVRDLLICFAENYKESLLEDSKICEALLNDDQTILEELEIAKQFKELAKQGKDKLTDLYNNIKTKIEALNDFIKDLFNKAIKDIKDVANKAIQLIEKAGESLFEIAQKIGFKSDQIENLSDELIKDLKNNKEVITQTNVYESYSIELQKKINEGIVDKVNDVKDWFSKTKVGKFAKTPVGKMVLGLLNWGLVCVVLPGIVAAILHSGALLTLIVPCVIKLVWNLKKIKKLVEQTKDLIRRWNTLATWEKLVNTLLLLANIAAFVFNIYSIGTNIVGKGIFNEFIKACKSGDLFSKLFTENGAAGIEPDSLTTFAAVWIKKLTGAEGSFDEIREEFLNGFKKEVKGATEVISELTDTATNAVNNINKSTEEATNKVKDIVDNYKGSRSRGLWDQIWKMFGKPNVSELDDNTVYRIVNDGTSSDKAAWMIELKNRLKDANVSDAIKKKTENLLNAALNSSNSNAGSVSLLELPGAIIKQNQDILGATGDMKNGPIFAILGPVKETVKEVVKNPEVVKQFFKHMLFDVPLTDLYIPKGKGFIVRLGNESQKEHYEYKIEKDGLYLEKKLTELKNEKGISEEDYKKIETEYNKIIEILTEENNKILKQVLKSNKKSEEEIKKEIEDNKDKYKEKLKEIPITVFCGKRWKEEKTNESFRSLYDYIISEAEESKNDYTVKDIINNLTDLRIHFEKVVKNAPVKQENEENHKEKSTSQDDTFKGNTQLMLRSIFKFTKSVDKKSGNEKNSTANFKYKDDFKPEPYISIVKRVRDNDTKNDMFGKEDIGIPAAYLSIIYDNKKYCDNLQFVFVDVLILKEHLLKISESTKLNDISDDEKQIIIASYKTMVHHLKQSNKFQTQIDNKEWVPLEFNESIDDKTKEQIQKTEDKNTVDTTPKDVEDKLRDADVTVEPPKPAEQDNQNDSDKDKKEDSTDDKDTDDGNVHPILLFVNCYGKDIAPYKGSKVREKFSMKGLMRSLFFKEYKKGMAIPDIKTMFGEILFNMVEQLQGMSALPPIVIKKNWWKDKKILNDKIAGDDERIDFGYLKNKDVVDILNNKKNTEKYVDLRSSITDILDSDEDKKELEKKQKDYNQKLENPDKKTIELVKKIDPEGIDKDGKIINKNEIADTLASYSIAKHKSKGAKKSGGGLFSKLKNFVKGLFGGNKDEGEKYVDLLNHFEESLYDNDNLITENLKENIEFLNECFGRITLSEYIKQK